MNRLGVGLNTANKNLKDSVENTVDVTPVIPEVGTAGPGGGTIFYIEQDQNTLTCYESLSSPFAVFNIFANNAITNDDLITSINNFLEDAYPQTYFQDNEIEGLTYSSNSDFYTVANITTEQAKNIIGFDSTAKIVNWEQGWFAEFVDSIPKINHTIIYKEYNEQSEEEALVVKIKINDSDLIYQSPLNNSVNEIFKLDSGFALHVIIYRKFVVEIPATIALMPSYPAAPNILPSEILLPPENALEFAATYNGLTSQTIPSLIDRYRSNSEVIDVSTGVDINPGDNKRSLRNSVRSENVIAGDETRKITFSSENRTIIAKVIYLLGTKPPNPWYDFAEDELLYLEATVLCLKTVRNTANLLSALAFDGDTNKINVPETRYNGQRLTTTQIVNGQTLYYGEIMFKIDVSNITFTEIEEESNVVKTVNDVVYDGTSDTYQLMLFELKNVKIRSNKRAGTAGKLNYLQTGVIAVPTYSDSSLQGIAIDTVFFSNDSPYNNSLKDGVNLMDSAEISYEFKAYNDPVPETILSSAPYYQNWAPLSSLNIRTGAITSDYKTINLSSFSKVLKLNLSLTFLTPTTTATTSIQVKSVITNPDNTTEEEILGTITLEGLTGDSLTVTDKFIEIPANGGSFQILVYANSSTNGNYYLVSSEDNYYSGSNITQSSPNPNTIIRTRYNYL